MWLRRSGRTRPWRRTGQTGAGDGVQLTCRLHGSCMSRRRAGLLPGLDVASLRFLLDVHWPSGARTFRLPMERRLFCPQAQSARCSPNVSIGNSFRSIECPNVSIGNSFDPSNAPMCPLEILFDPSNGSMHPLEVLFDPSNGSMHPLEVLFDPLNGSMRPLEIPFDPSNGSMHPLEILFGPSNAPMRPLEIFFNPSNAAIGPLEIPFGPSNVKHYTRESPGDGSFTQTCRQHARKQAKAPTFRYGCRTTPSLRSRRNTARMGPSPSRCGGRG